MIKKLPITTGSRYLIAFFNLAILLLCAKFLGTEGLGFTSLFILGLVMNQQICSFLGGNGLVYLAPRYNISSIILISYCGSVLIHLALIPLYLFLMPFEIKHFPEFFCISIMNVFLGINLNIMLGKNKVKQYHLLSIFQVLLQVSIFAFLAYNIDKINVNHFIFATGIGYFMALVGSIGVMVDLIPYRQERLFFTIKEIVKFGFMTESGNLLQLFAYRLNYFLINRWIGFSALGEFSFAVQLVESLHVLSRGITNVEYTYSPDTNSFTTKVQITRKSIIYSLAFTLAGIIVFLILPTSLFCPDFYKTKLIIAILIPGILLLCIGNIISPGFSHLGKYHTNINAIGASISFIVTALFSVLLVPFWGIFGAAIVNTLAYSAMTIFLYHIFKKDLVIT